MSLLDLIVAAVFVLSVLLIVTLSALALLFVTGVRF